MILLLCAVLFLVPFVYTSLGSLLSLNDTYILTLDASDCSSCNTRTLLDILSSCGLTLFACTWTAIHLDIPGMDEGIVAITFRHLLLMVIAFLAPEFVVAWAAWQLLCARQVAKDFNDITHAQHYDDHRAVWQRTLAAVSLGDIPIRSSAAGWSLTHGFFAQMGGFVLYVDDKRRATLTPEELLRFVREGSVEVFAITEADIEDQSKGDVLSKGVAILQLVWFVAQLIARYAQNLPVTLLEIDTLGVAALTCIAYGFWWKKPKDVQRPYIVHWKSATTPPPPHDSLANDKGRGPLSNLRSLMANDRISAPSGRTREQIIIIIGCISGMVFGMIHCLGWNFLFPKHAEQILWRVASIGIPVIFSAILGLIRLPRLLAGLPLLPGLIDNLEKFMMKATGSYIAIYIVFYYVPTRVMVIVLMILSLRSLPPGTYDTVAWSEFIPHVDL